MRSAHRLLALRLSEIRDHIDNGTPGSYWREIEDLEVEIANLILALSINTHHRAYLVPVSRTYQFADGRYVEPGPAAWCGGNDARDFAVRCRVVIADSDRYVFGCYSPASGMRGHGSDASFCQRFNLLPADDPLINQHMSYAIAAWQSEVDKYGKSLIEEADDRVRQLSVLMRELRSDVEQYRFDLFHCERVLCEYRATNPNAGDPSGSALLEWSRSS